jgi:hypothetical protein
MLTLAKQVGFMKFVVRRVFVVASKNLIASSLLTSCRNEAYGIEPEPELCALFD